MISSGLSERRSLRIIGMSASALRYEPASDRNCVLKEKIIALAQLHRRYGSGMSHLKLRQAGGPAGEEAQTQEDSPVRPAPLGVPNGRQSGVVHGLRV